MKDKQQNWSAEKVKEKLDELHLAEDLLNKEHNKLRNQIGQILIQQRKLQNRISGNMRYRSKLIALLPPVQPTIKRK